MDRRERELRERCRTNFPFYASRCLKIRTKEGAVAPFVLNKAQQYIHQRLEEQLTLTGRIRALILKGRQQGCSTYVEGRYYWKVTWRRGVRAYILTHEDPATQNLFEMAKRYHEHNNPLLKPVTGASSAKELFFPQLDSGYKVGTAGTKGTGRSGTYQYFHGSEVAFWANADSHAMGVGQAVPDMAGTELILESTANGLLNYFHTQWQLAEAGMSDYIAIFVPWYWQEEYRKEIPADFQLSDEERDYMEAYELDEEQIYWRRCKTTELSEQGEDGAWKFKQEYPATAAEAFQTAGDDPFIPASLVLPARKAKDVSKRGAKVVGLDPARYGDDRTSFAWRQGRVVTKVVSYTKKSTMEVAGLAARILDEDPDISQMFIDIGGLGAGVYDRLLELDFGDRVTPVNFGEKALNYGSEVVVDKQTGKPRPIEQNANRRAEMWREWKKWLMNKPCQIPDSDTLQADACAPQYGYDSSQRLKIESKDSMRARKVRSPDEADAVILTFAEPVAEKRTKKFRQPKVSVA